MRIIARLDVKGGSLVKGVHLEGLRVLGDPQAYARHYTEAGADELLYMDVVASLYGRNSLLDLVARTARATFIPLTVGGGLRTLEDIRDALRAGADKVAFNTAAVANPSLVQQAARRFGSSTIVASVEAIRDQEGRWFAFTDNGREETGLDAIEWATRLAELGAGELLITSVDREGTGTGFDLELTAQVATALDIPVIACGGAGSAAHVVEVVCEGRADAVAVASVLHYQLVGTLAEDGGLAVDGNTEAARRGVVPGRISPCSIADIKAELQRSGVEVTVHHG
jgi:cyclase